MSNEWIVIDPIVETPKEEYLPAVEEWTDIDPRYGHHTEKFGWQDVGTYLNVGPEKSKVLRRMRQPMKGTPTAGPAMWVENQSDSFIIGRASINEQTGETKMVPGTDVCVSKSNPGTVMRRGGFKIWARS